MKPEMSANCKRCGKQFWSGKLDQYKILINITNERNGWFCEVCADIT